MIDSQNENLNTNRPERNNENRKSQKKSKLKKIKFWNKVVTTPQPRKLVGLVK